MKIKQLLKKTACSLLAVSSLVSISSFLSVQPASANIGFTGCGGLQPGQWLWDTRRFTANIYSDGTIVANDGGRRITATWTCNDRNNGRITVHWSTGFVDTLTLSSDGNTLTGGNQTGAQFNVIKSGRPSSPPDLCAEIPGNWLWDSRFSATIYANGVISANEGGTRFSANWTCNSSLSGRITVNWSTGFIDSLTLTRRESQRPPLTAVRLEGRNNSGNNVIAVKR